LFVNLFVVIKPEDPYCAFRPGLEVKPLGVYPLGPSSSSCGPTGLSNQEMKFQNKGAVQVQSAPL